MLRKLHSFREGSRTILDKKEVSVGLENVYCGSLRGTLRNFRKTVHVSAT